MGIGIIVCGLNGAGKSTLGRALAEKLQYRFIDIEDLYFPKTDPHYLYASPRTREEVAALLFRELKTHENFVLASVKGDFGEAFSPFSGAPFSLTFPGKSGSSGSEPAPSRSSGTGCCRAEIYMSGKRNSST